MTDATYSDLDFFIQIGDAGQPIIKTDEDAIKQSIRTILTTRFGEREMQPEFGCNLHSILFQPMDVFTAISMEEIIITAIEKWEPRVLISSVNVTPDPDNNIYEVSISYTIREINTNANFTFAVASKNI